MGFLLNGQPLRVGRPFTDADGVQYPSNWLLIGTSPARLKLALKSRLLLPLTALQSAPPAAPARLKLTPAQPPKNWQHC
jgi:hypothetical protein